MVADIPKLCIDMYLQVMGGFRFVIIPHYYRMPLSVIRIVAVLINEFYLNQHRYVLNTLRFVKSYSF